MERTPLPGVAAIFTMPALLASSRRVPVTSRSPGLTTLTVRADGVAGAGWAFAAATPSAAAVSAIADRLCIGHLLSIRLPCFSLRTRGWRIRVHIMPLTTTPIGGYRSLAVTRRL